MSESALSGISPGWVSSCWDGATDQLVGASFDRSPRSTTFCPKSSMPSPRSELVGDGFSYHRRDVEVAAKGRAEPPAAAALLAAWNKLDEDGSGRLSAAEAAGLKQMLHINWDLLAVWDEAYWLFEAKAPVTPEDAHSDLDPGLAESPGCADQPREISFGTFVQVYNLYVGAERRKSRMDVKNTFEKLDAHHSGTLNKKQFATLVKRYSKTLSLLPPQFDLDRDWGYVTSDCESTDPNDPRLGVTWSQFERWWKNRCGLTEASTPIIPEYFLRQLENEHTTALPASATKGGGNCETVGSGLWKYLLPKLRAVAEMNAVWTTNAANAQSQTRSVYASEPVPPGIRDPDSTFSVVWDIAQVIFLLYVSIVVPYRACFGVEIQVFSPVWYWDTTIDVYFLADLALSFRTAYTDSHGIQVVDPKSIARRYLKGWFTLDAISCIPVGHISRIIEQTADEAGPDNVRALKALRLLRMSKMLRLARIKRILQKYESLMVVQEYLGLIFMMLSVVFIAHLLTCLWFLVGLNNQMVVAGRGRELGRAGVWKDPRSTIVLSWVHEQPWFEQNSSELIVTHQIQYVSSMYFVLNALDGYSQTDNEKVMGVVALVFTIVIKGSIAGIMSSMLISLAGKDQETTEKLRGIKSWLVDSRVSRSEVNRILDFFRHQFRTQAQTSDAQVLQDMPPGMSEEFRKLIYTKFLAAVPIFRGLSDEIMSALRVELKPMVATKGQVIFAEGSIGTELCTHSLHVCLARVRLLLITAFCRYAVVPCENVIRGLSQT